MSTLTSLLLEEFSEKLRTSLSMSTSPSTPALMPMERRLLEMKLSHQENKAETEAIAQTEINQETLNPEREEEKEMKTEPMRLQENSRSQNSSASALSPRREVPST